MSTTASQQFEGTTIEEALAAAVSTLGEDLEILDAQRVRRRSVLGVRKRERFEVTATPGGAEPKGFETVLRRMVERVDQAERVAGADLADTDPAWWVDADFVVPGSGETVAPGNGKASRRMRRRTRPDVGPDGPGDLELDVRAPGSPAAPASVLAAAATLVEERPQAGANVAPPTVATTRPPSPTPAAPSVIEDDTPIWSCDALLALDLPPALVGRLRPDELGDDLDWVAALAKAISELLETAESMSGPCELTGHGAASAVHLLRGACDGFRLDSLIIDGQRVPATPLELALAVRSLLRIDP